MATAEPKLIVILGGALLGGCAAPPAGALPSAQPQAEAPILASSTPAAGSTVRGSVDELALRFDPPARLDEVIVTGSQGDMPMMVHAVGEVADYSVPLPDLGAGSYTVKWRATAQGRAYRGSFGFTVR